MQHARAVLLHGLLIVGVADLTDGSSIGWGLEIQALPPSPEAKVGLNKARARTE